MSNTSWQAKKRYNKKTYKRICVDLYKQLVLDFEVKLKVDGMTKAEFFRNTIEEYLKK